MTVAEAHQLSLGEKIQIMEPIWEDLRSQAESVPVPEWHKNLLDARQQAVAEGREEILDWDTIKNSLNARHV